jgi:uncharacterized repeat protein (TIGR03847 family)
MLVHRYDLPERFVAGTVGAPGERTFFLQARDGARLTSVSLEKEQVSVLSDRLEDLLERVGESTDFAIDVATDVEPLDQPIEEEFRVGTMTLAWDEDTSLVVIEAFAITESEEDEADEVLEVRVTPEMARAFAVRGRQVISAGRATCQFCGQPMNPSGHLCPRANGFKRISRA